MFLLQTGLFYISYFFCTFVGMNAGLWISRRMRLGASGTGSPAAVVIAVVGVALAVMVMEFTLAIVTGFKSGIREKLSGFEAQVSVLAPIGGHDCGSSDFLTYTPELDSVVTSAVPAGADVRMAIRQPGILKTDDDFQGVIFLGQSPQSDFDFERANIVEGRWPDFACDTCDNEILVSRSLANRFNLGVGDKVFSTFVIDGNVKMRRHKVAGLYVSNFGEYDNSVVYASLRGLQKVAGVDSLSAGSLDIRGIPFDEIGEVSGALRNALLDATARETLDSYYPVDDILRTGALYFNWLELLDTNVAVIFILMLAVAGFTLVSSLFILILERVRTIGVLRAIGGSRAFIRAIFIDLGMRLVVMGLLAGNVAGLGLLLIQKYTRVLPLDPEMYYLDAVPVEFVPWQFMALNVGVIVVSWLILAIPAGVAAHTDPSKAIESD